MGYVYRYTDRKDNIVKYIGIVYADRSLYKRIMEHEREMKFNGYDWKIDYIEVDLPRTDIEWMESHFISLYKTYLYLNGVKNWGISKFLSSIHFEWKEYELERDLKYSIKECTKKKRRGGSFIKMHRYIFETIPKELADGLKNIRVIKGESQELDVFCIYKLSNMDLYESICDFLFGITE